MKNRGALIFLGMATALFVTVGAVQAKESKPSPKETAAKAEKAAKEAKAAAELNGTKWSVELTPSSGEGAKKSVKDTLTFEGGKVSSQSLSRDGYPTSNFTLTIGNDGSTTVWETMQTKEGVGVAFWRGERQADAMHGVLSKHLGDGIAQDYYFSGKLTESKPASEPAVAPAKQPAVATPAQPAAPVAKPADASTAGAGVGRPNPPAKQKKGW